MKLSLRGNDLDDESFRAIVEGLPHSRLTEFAVSCRLYDQARAIVRSIGPSLRVLSLGLEVTYDMSQWLHEAIRQPFSRVALHIVH